MKYCHISYEKLIILKETCLLRYVSDTGILILCYILMTLLFNGLFSVVIVNRTKVQNWFNTM